MKKVIILVIISLTYLFIGCGKELPEDDNQTPETDLNGVTWSNIYSITPPFTIKSNIVNYEEILGYDSLNYTFLLTDEAGKRIRSIIYPVSPISFGIAIDGEVIYVAYFIPGYSSMSCHQCITIEPYSYNNKYKVYLGYPPLSEYYTGIDPRNDKKLYLDLLRMTN